MYLRARTLFFVILFSNIYKQRHTSTRYITDNEFLLNMAKFFVRNRYGFIRIALENVAKNILTNITSLKPSKTRQKIAIITTSTEMSEEPAAGRIKISKNMGCYQFDFKSWKSIPNQVTLPLVSTPDISKRNSIEITLIKANII